MKLAPGIYKVKHNGKKSNSYSIMFVYKRKDTGQMCYDIGGGAPVDLKWFNELARVTIIKQITEFKIEKAHIEIHITDDDNFDYEYRLSSILALKRLFRIYPQIKEKLL